MMKHRGYDHDGGMHGTEIPAKHHEKLEHGHTRESERGPSGSFKSGNPAAVKTDKEHGAKH